MGSARRISGAASRVSQERWSSRSFVIPIPQRISSHFNNLLLSFLISQLARIPSTERPACLGVFALAHRQCAPIALPWGFPSVECRTDSRLGPKWAQRPLRSEGLGLRETFLRMACTF